MIERLRGKADSLDALEGSSPECAMASIQGGVAGRSLISCGLRDGLRDVP